MRVWFIYFDPDYKYEGVVIVGMACWTVCILPHPDCLMTKVIHYKSDSFSLWLAHLYHTTCANVTDYISGPHFMDIYIINQTHAYEYGIDKHHKTQFTSIFDTFGTP